MRQKKRQTKRERQIKSKTRETEEERNGPMKRQKKRETEEERDRKT